MFACMRCRGSSCVVESMGLPLNSPLPALTVQHLPTQQDHAGGCNDLHWSAVCGAQHPPKQPRCGMQPCSHKCAQQFEQALAGNFHHVLRSDSILPAQPCRAWPVM